MLRVLFFGSLAEQVGMAELALDWQPGWQQVQDVLASLHRSHPAIAQVLAKRRGLLIAVNQRIGAATAAIADQDELAFLPPVTGG
ncbi:MAG TPA: MoaD/ThiS family protein [Permianibacter sp.]|nr:MoaD/ThiS family protein [Permianibacter sp.]